MTPDFTIPCNVDVRDGIHLYGYDDGSITLDIHQGEQIVGVALTPGDVIRLSRALKQLVERRWQ